MYSMSNFMLGDEKLWVKSERETRILQTNAQKCWKERDRRTCSVSC